MTSSPTPASDPVRPPCARRDLGTEGAEDADVQLRKCMAGPDPLVPGPRYFCASRALIASGSYGASRRNLRAERSS